jgi:hypothetical protein
VNVLARGVSSMALRWLAGPRTGAERAADPARFGIRVEDPRCVERIRGVLRAFFGGLESGLQGGVDGPGAAAPPGPLHRPFFEEGKAMAVVPAGHLCLRPARASIARFLAGLAPADPFLLLRHVGLGFWLGFRHPRAPARMEAAAARVSPRYRHLLHDGYGFKLGFFDLPRFAARWGREAPASGPGPRGPLDASPAVRGLRALPGFARRSAFHGVGRSLWFFSMDRPEGGFRAARGLGEDAPAVFGGLGLAAAFTWTDDLSVAYGAAALLAGGEARQFEKGIRIALYARAECDADFLQGAIGALAPGLRARAAADLARALDVGRRTRDGDDFIQTFHEGCLDA